LWATDISAAALEVAAENVKRLGVAGRVVLCGGDLFTPLGEERFDIVTANLPYVPTGEIAGLGPEIGREPRLALDGGEDGLSLLRRFVGGVAPRLLEAGVVLVEHGPEQGSAVRTMFEAADFDPVTRRDLAGRERVTVCRR
jgi:release factor glutamine methyltransferase